MPFIEDDSLASLYDSMIPVTPEPTPETGEDMGFWENVKREYARNTGIGARFAREAGLPDSQRETDFNVWENLTEDERLDERFSRNAAFADNEFELEALRKQTANERRLDDELKNGSMLAGVVAQLGDPINYLPFFEGARVAKSGSSALKGALTTGLSAGAGTTLQELMIRQNQLEREFGESATNVTVSAMFGGILGGLSGKASDIITDKVRIAEMEKVMDPEQMQKDGFNSALGEGFGSVGAAGVEDAVVRGRLARWMAGKVALDPLTRTMLSQSSKARQLNAKMVENPLDMDKQDVSNAAETRINAHGGKYFAAREGHDSAFVDWKKANPKGKRRQFNEEVAKAMRNGSSDVHVQRAADAWEEKLYAPMRDEAINLGLLPKDVEVTTAKGYLNRQWNHQKITAYSKRFTQIVTDYLKTANPNLDDDDAGMLASDIMNNILGSADGRLPYDFQMPNDVPKKGGGGNRSDLSGVLKSRTFNIPDAMVEDFLENDIERLGARYLQQIAPDIELTRSLGSVDIEGYVPEIRDEYQAMIDRADTPKAKEKLRKEMGRTISDLRAMNERIRHRYKIPDHNHLAVRAGRVARNWNYMRMLGGVVASSIPDLGKIVMAEGFLGAYRNGLKPLVTNLKAFKMSGREAKLAGQALDMLGVGGRAELFADISDYTQGGTMLERGMQSASEQFSRINLMAQWTTFTKQLHAVTMQTRMINDILQKGWSRRLDQLGFDKGLAKRMQAELQRHAINDKGVMIANTEAWTDPELVNLWRQAISKESNRVIINIGQEKPLFMSNEWGKTLFQFKSFMFSASQRVLLSGLQKQDAHMIEGVTAMIGLGMLSYAFKQWDAGREISDDPAVWVAEGIDRSGALGILMEFNNTLEKMLSNKVGLRPLLGVDAPASRYASRSVVDSMVGPTFGLAGDIASATTIISNERDFSQSDANNLRRLIPGQNLSFIRQKFKQLLEVE